MRQIILDTETTGLNARLGDRIVEIGCVELVNRRFTGNHFHHYINPERPVEEGALKVHGLTDEFLSDKPKFQEIADEFLDFVRDAEILIHNAAFDVEFVNEELGRLKRGSFDAYVAKVVDTLAQAREMHPGKRNSLDALCERYGVDNGQRALHGALLDAHLLAEVYLAMTRGQESLAIDVADSRMAVSGARMAERPRGPLVVIRATDEEIVAHAAVLEGIQKESKGQCVWLAVGAADPAPAG